MVARHLHPAARLTPTGLNYWGLLLLILAAVFFLLDPIIELPFEIWKGYNEGWNALQAQRVVENARLYPAYDDVIGNNYPPLSYYFIAPLGQLIGDNIIAGRLVSLLSLLAAAGAAGIIVYTTTSSAYWSVVSAISIIGFMAARYGGYVANNDPQLLGHAFMLTGAALLLRSKAIGPTFYLACLMTVAGGFVKHSLIALPLAATIWLLIDRRAWFWHWVGLSLLLIVSGLTLATIAYGGDFLRQLFLDARVYSLWSGATEIDRWFAPLMGLVVLSALIFPLAARMEYARFVVLYLLIAAAWGAILLGGAGLGGNAVFDVVFALGIALGIVMHHVSFEIAREAQHQIRWWPSVMVFCLVVMLAPAAPKYAFELRTNVKGIQDREAATREDVAFLASHEGPAACESLSLCYWAGKDFEFDFFLTGQKLQTGAIETSHVTRLLADQHYGVIQVDRITGISARLPSSVTEALHEHYELVRTSDVSGAFFVPRREAHLHQP